MIYRVHYKYAGESEGFQYFRNKKEALADIKAYLISGKLENAKEDPFLDEENTEYEAYICAKIKTPKTKQEIISTLNIYGGHADNG